MALLYKAVQSTVKNKEGEKTWHLALVKSGAVVGTQTLGEKIAISSAASPGDSHNILRNLGWVVREELLNGNSVKIEGFGTFTLRARTGGKGVLTADEVNPSQVKSLHCQFTPEFRREGSNTTRALTQGATYIHVNRLRSGLASDGGSNNNSGGGNTGGNGGGGDEFIDPSA